MVSFASLCLNFGSAIRMHLQIFSIFKGQLLTTTVRTRTQRNARISSSYTRQPRRKRLFEACRAASIHDRITSFTDFKLRIANITAPRGQLATLGVPRRRGIHVLKMHQGLGHFVDEPTELHHARCWLASVCTTSGEYAHFKDAKGRNTGTVFPSDFVYYWCRTGKRLNLSMQHARQRADTLPGRTRPWDRLAPYLVGNAVKRTAPMAGMEDRAKEMF